MENNRLKALNASARRGMTLIEILVVVAILGMLATAVTVTVLDQFEDAKGERARMDIAAITQGLSAYYIKMGTTTGEAYNLVSPPKAARCSARSRKIRRTTTTTPTPGRAT